MKVLVIGDVMLDKFTECTPIRMSDEAPVLIVKKGTPAYRLGGAGNVAINLRKLGIDVTLQGLVGIDDAANELMKILASEEIHKVLEGTKNPTIVKHRLLANGQQLLRVDTEKKFEEPNLKVHYDKFDAIVVSDYAKGTITEDIMNQVKRRGILTFVNGKPSDIDKYEDVDILTFNKKEFEDCKKEFGLTGGEHLCGRYNVKFLVVTQGKDGIILYTESNQFHVKGIPVEVADITGAGDTVLATLVYGMLRYNHIRKAIELANKAGSVVVQKPKTAFVTKEELGEV